MLPYFDLRKQINDVCMMMYVCKSFKNKKTRKTRASYFRFARLYVPTILSESLAQATLTHEKAQFLNAFLILKNT